MAIIYSVDPRYNADNAFTTWAQQKAFTTNLTHTLMLTSKPTHARLIIDYYVSFITCRVFQWKQPNQYYCEVCNWFYTHTSPFRSLNFKIKSKIQMDVKLSLVHLVIEDADTPHICIQWPFPLSTMNSKDGIVLNQEQISIGSNDSIHPMTPAL